jgi:hypothetical protein
MMRRGNINCTKRNRNEDCDLRPLKSHKSEENQKIYDSNDLNEENNIWNKLNNTKYNNNGKYMSATKTANYLLDDPLLDWLDLYYKDLGLNLNKITENQKLELKKEYESNKKNMSPYFDGGLFFEDMVMENLEKKFGINFCVINKDGKNGLNEANYKKTIDMMMKGKGIIAQGVLFNKKNNTCGFPDLLVRSDFINKIVNVPILPQNLVNLKAPNLKGKFHYLVIDIKWSTLHFSSRNNILLKTGRIPAYKGQVSIYNCALGNIQGYFPQCAYVLGKGWKREKAINKKDMAPEELKWRKEFGGSLIETTSSNNCFDQLGIVDFEGNDISIIEKTSQAIKWYEDVSTNGMKWSPLNPTNENMYPNMSNDDLVWGKIKSFIAKEIGEITQVCNVGINERRNLHKKGIYTCWDKKCNSENMGLGCTETSQKINAVLDINRDKQYNVYPRKIQNNFNNWQESSPIDFYFDFETLNCQFMKNETNIQNSQSFIAGLIFEIGVGWIENGQWCFEKFYIDNVNQNEEARIVDEFFQFIVNKSQQLDSEKKFYPRLFHWTNAERNNLNDVNKRNNYMWNSYVNGIDIKYIDMYKVFTSDLICVKGAYNYKLKSIGKALYKLGKIKTAWPDTDITNGQIAMLEAIKYYKNKKNDCLTEIDNNTFNDIIKYNEVDCKIIWEIVEYLRLKHNDLDLDYEEHIKLKREKKAKR